MFDHYLYGLPWEKIATYTAIGLFAALILALVIIAAVKKTELFTTRDIAFAAVCLALAYVLSFIKIYQMPNGGSLTLASALPLLLYSYLFGFKKGLYVGLVYSLLQILQKPEIYNPIQVLLDYPLAFTAVAAGGLLGKKDRLSFVLGGIVFMTIRFVCHYLSGVVFFYMYAEGLPAPLYSLVYNLYVLIDAAIAIALGFFILSSKTLSKKLYEYAASPKAQVFES